jgi:hypothetical protein
MTNKFDELAKGLAQSTTRRQALKKFGVGLAGMALACFGLANKAEAGPQGLAGAQTMYSASPANVDGCGDQPCPGSTAPTTPLQYWGGPLLSGAALTSAGGGPTVYVIWYGNWNQSNGADTPEGQQIVYDFLYGASIGPYSAYGSPYYSINNTLSTNGYMLNGKMAYGGSCSVGYLFGTTVAVYLKGIENLHEIVSYAICGTTPPLLPDDPNGVYLIISSSDVDVTTGFAGDFGVKFCGLYGVIPGGVCGNNRVLMWEENTGDNNSGYHHCKAQLTGPNGNTGVDGMLSTMAHDLADAINNGFLDGWHTASGADSGNDGCNWTYGQNMQQVYIPKYGLAYYNVTLPSPHTGPGAPTGYRNYLLSRLVAHNVTVNGVTGDYCAVSYDPITGGIRQ